MRSRIDELALERRENSVQSFSDNNNNGSTVSREQVLASQSFSARGVAASVIEQQLEEGQGTGPVQRGAPVKHAGGLAPMCISGDRGIILEFKAVCKKVDRAYSEVIGEFMLEYVRSYRSRQNGVLDEFIPPEQRESLHKAPVVGETSMEEASLHADSLNVSEMTDHREWAKAYARMLKYRIENKTNIVIGKERKALAERKAAEEKERKKAELLKRALPERTEPDAPRKEELKRLWSDLQRPDHDRRGGLALRTRRQRVIQHILALQERLTFYQKCQDFQEWEQKPIDERSREYEEVLGRIEAGWKQERDRVESEQRATREQRERERREAEERQSSEKRDGAAT